MVAKSKDNQGGVERVYLFHGADDAQKRVAVERMIADLVDPDYRDFDFEAMYGPGLTADRLMSAAAVPPIASKRRVLVVSQANEMSASEQQSLASRLDRIPDSTCVILVTPAPEMSDGKPKSGSEVHKDLQAAVRKAGKSVDHPLLKDQPAIAFVQGLLKKAGKNITSTAAAAVVRRCGTDSGILTTEVEKLINFVGDAKTVTDAEVEEVVTETTEEKLFAMMDAVGRKDAAQALHYLRPLLYGAGGRVEGPTLRTLTMLARHFRQIWQAKLLMEGGCRIIAPGAIPEHLEAMLPQDNNILKQKDWQIKKFMEQSRNFTADEIAGCFEKIAGVDLALKGIEGSITDPGLAMEMLVIQLSSRRPNAKRGRHMVPSP